MDLISREAVKKEIIEEWDGSCSEYGPNQIINDTLSAVDRIPSVPAVPLDKLCEWLSESSINIPCASCKNFVNEYCTAIGDKNRPCPNSADDWRRAITEWMEEQDVDRK